MRLFRYEYIIRIIYKYKKKYRSEIIKITSYKKLNENNVTNKIKRKNFKIVCFYLFKKEFIFMDFYRNFKKKIIKTVQFQLNYMKLIKRK